jgi:2-phosphosulfolactate phosphatase
MATFTSQADFDIRFDWAINGVKALANHADVAVIVDVLSFSTCVDIACARDAYVLPYRYVDASAQEFASTHNAVLATKRSQPGFSLSPTSLINIAQGTKLVLPSPNGATLALVCTASVVLAGCLRNAGAVSAYAQSRGGSIAVIAAAEQWPDGASRFAFEDLIGAGSIIHALAGSKSPAARAAEAAFLAAEGDLPSLLLECTSGKELVERGFRKDVSLASDLNVSTCVPLLKDGAFIAID